MSGKFRGLLFLVAIIVPTHSITSKAGDVLPSASPSAAASHSETHSSQERSKIMPARKDEETAARAPGVVNWDPPTKRDLVERALRDGMTDPAQIVEKARNRKVTMTIEEVLRIKAELEK
jgi:hypothetical protein